MVLVLAGGGGERLSVLTYERAVSALPFGGKYRVIDFVLSNCSHSHLTVVGILTQHAPISLNDHIGAGRPWDLDRREGGVLILQPFTTRTHAGWYRGTADAIAQNWDVIEDHRPERILVLSGDQIYRMDYRSLMHTHEQQRAAVTLAVTRVPSSQTPRFGMTTIDRDGRVTELIEKPERAATPFASMGIYLFEYGALAEAMRLGPQACGIPRPTWTAPLLASYLAEKTGIAVGEQTVRHYLALLDYVCRRPTWTVRHKAEEQPDYALKRRGSRRS